MQQYKKIEIFTSEEARWEGRPLYAAIVQFVHDLKIAARCLVTRGIEGSYESGEIATGRLEVLSYNMPVRITIIVPAAESERILSKAEEMVTDGIVAVQDLRVISHKTRGLLMPRHTRVRDIMTPAPKKVNLDTLAGRSGPPAALFHLYRPSGGGWRKPAGRRHLPGGFNL